MPMYCQYIDISTLHRYIPLYLYLNLAPIHFTVSISQPCTNTFHCINISTLHQYISLYQYLNPALMHSSVSISRHNNSPPSRQRSASTHSFPAGHRETQPFVPVIQRSADDPSNSRETTSLPTLNQIPTPSTHFPICSLLTCNPSDNPEFLQEESDAICSLLTCNPSRHRHSIPSALKSQPVRRVLSVTGLCRRGAAS